MSHERRGLVRLTTDIVAAHVANNSVPTSEVPGLISTVHAALSQLGSSTPDPLVDARPAPATTARRSLANSSHIISMIDGKPYKVLRRHISHHGYTPESYREAFGLPKDYPMVAGDYTEKRRALAQSIGLGRKPVRGQAARAASVPEEEEPRE